MPDFEETAAYMTRRTRSDDVRAISSIVVKYPDKQESRAMYAKWSVLHALEEIGYDTGKFRIERSKSYFQIFIDEYASVMMPSSCNELTFQLQMRAGPHILLVTDDVYAMSCFVRQYGQARICDHKDLRAVL